MMKPRKSRGFVLITGIGLTLITMSTIASAGLPVAPRSNAKPASISGSNVNASPSTRQAGSRALGGVALQKSGATPGATTGASPAKGANAKGAASHN